MSISRNADIIERLLSLEHKNIAKRLKLIQGEPEHISVPLLYKAVGLLNQLSTNINEENRKLIVTLSAIMWTYRERNTQGLSDFLIKILSRIGFAPSSTMFDEQFDKNTDTFSSLQSFVDELYITAYHLKTRVTVGEKTYTLTEFQFKIWETVAINKVVGISAPTSAGKSFLIALKTIDLLLESPGNVIYIVPTISLVNQVTIDYRKLLREHNLQAVQILNTYMPNETGSNNIYVLTQEKAIAAFGNRENPFTNLRLLVIDEVQNIERVADENDQRAKTLFDLIIEFRENCAPDRIILSGPRIGSIGKLGKDLTGVQSADESTTSSPVTNLTYALSRQKKAIFFKQYSGIHRTLSLAIDSSLELKLEGSQYNENVHQLIFDLINNLGKDSINIIFSPTSGQAESTAAYLAQKIVLDKKPRLLQSLSDYIGRTVHPKYDLITMVSAGLTYHHGKMPHHVRRVIERAISDKLLTNIVCTTTLMQGVNLPAQTIIVRNPNLFIRSQNGTRPKLTNYEIANLRGRAGRLLKDFLGRTIVLDENQFDIPKTGTLFDDEHKQLTSGYQVTFNDYKRQIIDDIQNHERVSEKNKEHGFLTTYIRQVAIKRGNNTSAYLKRVGIELPQKEVATVLAQVNQIVVNRAICLKNRYWDPLVLNDLFLKRQSFSLPTAPSDSDIATRLRKMVETLRKVVPFYVEKYFNIEDKPQAKLLTSTCITAASWIKEVPLSNILNTKYYNDNPSNISSAVKTVQSDISYKLPVLLHPLYDMIYPESSFLRFLELGAYRPITRRLIEYGLPRETAIELQRQYLANLTNSQFNFERDILPPLRNNLDKMHYWLRIQLDVIL